MFNSGFKNFIKIDYHPKNNLTEYHREVLTTFQQELNQITSKINPFFQIVIVFVFLMMLTFSWGIYMLVSGSQFEYTAIPVISGLFAIGSMFVYYFFRMSCNKKIEKLHEFYFRTFYPDHILLKNWAQEPSVWKMEMVLVPLEMKEQNLIDEHTLRKLQLDEENMINEKERLTMSQ